jgi:hypothetical protein
LNNNKFRSIKRQSMTQSRNWVIKKFSYAILMIGNERACKVIYKSIVVAFSEWPSKMMEKTCDMYQRSLILFFPFVLFSVCSLFFLTIKRILSSNISKARACSALQNWIFKPSPTAFWIWLLGADTQTNVKKKMY